MLASLRLRLLLVLILWMATIVAIVLWLGGQQEQDISIGAGPAGSESFELLSAVADVLNEADHRFTISVFETGGTVENMDLLARGQLDMGSVQADASLPEEALGIAQLYPDAYHLVVNASAGIKLVPQLRERRIAIPPTASAQDGSFWFLMQHYGLAAEDMAAQPMSSEAANFAMLQGQVDAVFRVRAPGNRRIRELIGDKTMEIVPINQAQALSLKQPALSPGVIPRGSYRGHPALPRVDLPTVVLSRLLVASAALPDQLVYRFTRAMFESRNEIAARVPLAGFLSPLGEDAAGMMPVHGGAQQYFDREKPSIVSQNARLVSAMLYAIVIVFSGILALRSRWRRARRVRMGDFNKRLMKIAEHVRSDHDQQNLLTHKSELLDILAEVVDDLDQEKVSQDEFEHFSFTWQAVDALLRDQTLLYSVAANESVTSKGVKQ